jgi:hypothetical protein
VLKYPSRKQTSDNSVLSDPFFRTDCLLVDAHGDPGIGMAGQLLRRLDVDPMLSEHRRQSVPEGVETLS